MKKKTNKTIKEINEAFPDLKDKKVFELANTLEDILKVKRLVLSKDGDVLLTVLKNNCFNALNKLVYVAKNEPDMNVLLGLISSYSANIDLLSQLQDINTEDEIRKQLDEAVIEAIG